MASLEERFNQFNTNLALANIRMQKLTAGFDEEKLDVPPDTQQIYIDKNSYYQILGDNVVRVFQEYQLKIADKQNKTDEFVSIEVTYLMDFQTGGPIDDEIFELFSQSTVLIDSWPYFREIVQNTLIRMGLAPVIIPPIQFTPPPAAQQQSQQ
jgi:preprotein translocase subunit SecB